MDNSEPRKFIVIRISPEDDESRKEHLLLSEVGQSFSSFYDKYSGPVEEKDKSDFINADLSTKAASKIKKTLEENRDAPNFNSSEATKHVKKESGNTILAKTSSSDLIYEIWRRATLSFKEMTSKGYSAMLKRFREDGLNINDKFK